MRDGLGRRILLDSTSFFKKILYIIAFYQFFCYVRRTVLYVYYINLVYYANIVKTVIKRIVKAASSTTDY
jgi:hypothetical protein